MKTILILTSLLGLCACSGTEELAACKGPIFALNAGHWQPTPADLEVPKLGKAE